MTTDRYRVGIVVVNYASHQLLRSNVARLSGRSEQHDLRVVVVDSHSTDAEEGAVEQLCADQGWTFVPTDRNVGFGAGMNLGAARAIADGCDRLLLLNPDVEIRPEQVDELVTASRVAERCLVSPRIVRPDGSTWFAGGQLDRRRGRTRSRVDLDQRGPDRWLTGACLVMSASTWSALGGFDERYFLYWEDVDLSHRCLELGGDLHVAHEVEVVHDVGGTQSGSGKSLVYLRANCRNRLLFAGLHLSRREAWRWVLTAPGYLAWILTLDGRRALLRRPWSVLSALAGTVAGLGACRRALRARGAR
jgi:GT2 family glycosyltransferase